MKIVHWTILFSNFIGQEKEFLNETVQLQKLIFFRLFLISKITRERIKVSKRFWHY